MRWFSAARRGLVVVCTALLAGGLCGIAAVALVASATARTASASAVFDVTHLPPLLTAPGDDLQLVYDVHCAAAGDEDPEAGCRVGGTVFARPAGGGSFRPIPLEQAAAGARLVASVPSDLARSDAFEYYAVVESPDVATRMTVPAGGALAPAVSRRLDDPTTIALGRHAFGDLPRPDARVVSAGWGDGPAEVGIETGRNPDPIGASGFDVDAGGSIVVLDQAHRRVLRWTRGARIPDRVPLSINGTIADLLAAEDGSLYVLETTSADDRAPLVRRFDGDGRELEAIEAAERGTAQIQAGPDGPVVLQRPSHQWMPVTVSGVPAAPAAQRRRGRMGRPLRSGGEVVVFHLGNELRVALVARGKVARSWIIRSDTPLGEVQLAEPLGARFVVVLRVYEEARDEFAVLLLDHRGLISKTSLASADWAEAAPLGRFRLVGRSLYRLGSTAAGIFVDRYDLEVR
jgi:hypothetical protein